MCLGFEPRHRAETLKRQAKPKVHTYYKVVTSKYTTISIPSLPYYKIDISGFSGPFYGNIEYKPGVFKSDRKLRSVGLNQKEITRGVHVCTNLTHAIKLRNNYDFRTIIKVQCDDRDLVMINDNEAVYMKITISKEEHQKGLRNLKRRLKKV
jgi:hypothetical protein